MLLMDNIKVNLMLNWPIQILTTTKLEKCPNQNIPNLCVKSSLNEDNVYHPVFDKAKILLLFLLQDMVSFELYNYDDIW